ncbi:hypothetical protein Droror1_Dr00024682 [Drosera rotundifolia]
METRSLLTPISRLSISQLKQVHARIITNHHQSLKPIFVEWLLNLSCTGYARKMFDKMPLPSPTLYNMFVAAYSKQSLNKEAVDMFVLMHSKNAQIFGFSVPPVVKSCSGLMAVELGKQVHSVAVQSGLDYNVFSQTAFMDFYAKTGVIGCARLIFDGIKEKDVVSYNCLISGYAKSSNVLAARGLFDEMSERTIVSWNSIMASYAHVGDHHEAMRLFERMLAERFEPNGYTFVILLSVCSKIGDLDMGLRVKKFIDERNMFQDMIVATALLEMFVKCGDADKAREVFDRMEKKDIVAWGAMMAGYAQNGRLSEALELFECMKQQKIKPSNVIISSVLTVCGQLGSIETGERIGSYVESEGLRICVKNIPKYVTEDRLREFFAQRGEVTDAKLKHTIDGKSRQFGFIGYWTVEEAEDAIKYFNNSYLDTCRITCEIAHKVGDPNIPRPWSQYSKEKEKKTEDGKTVSGQKDTSKGLKTVHKGSKKIGELDDPMLREFLQVMQPRSKSKLWADDVVFPSTVDENGVSSSKMENEEKSVKKQVNGNLGAEMDTTLNDQSLGKKSRNLACEDVVSDMDYFKSRVKKEWSDSDSDTENDNDSDENNKPSAERHLDDRSGMEVDSVFDDNGKALWKDEEPLEQSENQLTSSEKPSSSEYGAANVSKTGRLFIRNLPYAATEEELDELFSKYGNVSEVHVVVDKDTRRSKGLAYVLYGSPDFAVRALEELDHSIFQGRLLHVMPAKAQNSTANHETNDSGSHTKTFKQKREEEREASEAGGKTQAWNSLFMRPDTVVEFMARKYGVSKRNVLDREKDNLAVHIELGETEVINETKKALANVGVNVSILEEFASKKTEDIKRSKKIILVKNLPYSCTEADLYDMFSKFGGLDRVIFPPTRTLALAVFLEWAGARAAFSSLAYKRFRDAPLYLEWAPKGIISGSTTVSMDQTTSNLVVGECEVKKVLLDQDVKGISYVDIDPERIELRSLFIKNLNFKTSDESLRKHLVRT